MESFEIRLTNLSWAATEQDIRDFVSTFAKVKEVKLVMDFRKRSKGNIFIIGLAYVRLEDENSLNEALKEVERTHLDRIIKIIKAKPLSEKNYDKPKEDRPKREHKPKVSGEE